MAGGWKRTQSQFTVVDHEQIPTPDISDERSQTARLYLQLEMLPIGKAIRIDSGTRNTATGIRTRLRKWASANRRILSSSRGEGGTIYLWLEPEVEV